jgi:hypothetical protein
MVTTLDFWFLFGGDIWENENKWFGLGFYLLERFCEGETKQNLPRI